MQNSVTSLIATSRRLKKWTGYALCLLLLTWAGWSGCERLRNPEQPKEAAHSRTDIAARALRIAAVLNGAARLQTPPVFLKSAVHNSANGLMSRNFWIVLCEAGNQQANMVFDDKSGRLSCLVMNYMAANKERHSLLPPVKTPSEAAIVAVERLKALEVLPPGGQIALQETPLPSEGKSQWETKWLVRASPTDVPYTLKLAISKNTGLPISLMDFHTAQ